MAWSDTVNRRWGEREWCKIWALGLSSKDLMAGSISVSLCVMDMFTTSLMIKCFKQNFNALFYRYFLFASSETNRIPTNTKSSEISELIHGFIYKASLAIFYYCIQLKEWQSIICVAFDLDLLSNKTALKINTICKLFTVNACTNMHTQNHWTVVGNL